MNSKQIEQKIREGKPGRFRIDTGLYLRVLDEGSGHFVVRYSHLKKRKEITLGKFSNRGDELTLAEAREQHLKTKKQLKAGSDPLQERKREQALAFTLVGDVAADWLKACERRIQNPQIPKRVYKSDIAPAIGKQSINKVSPPDVLNLLRKIRDSGRPTIANDALSHIKKIFNHAIKLGLITVNPAAAFTMQDAGGTEHSRTRVLTLDEINAVFEVMREQHLQFTRDNYLAFILLLCLGVRKTELTAAQWEEFDLEDQIWTLPPERTKTQMPIKIPLSNKLIPILTELKTRACGSEYLFPSRRRSKRRGYISDDTLNHALGKLFGKDAKSKSAKNAENHLGNRGITHFTIHDLRRTFRSLLAENGTPFDIAERCLNHKIKGVAGIYDRYDYFNERKAAMDVVAGQIMFLAMPD